MQVFGKSVARVEFSHMKVKCYSENLKGTLMEVKWVSNLGNGFKTIKCAMVIYVAMVRYRS